MNTAEKLINEIKFEINTSWRDLSPWGVDSFGYEIQLSRNGLKMVFDFWQGIGIKELPTLETVLESLCIEATSIDTFKGNTVEGFLSWCDELGLEATFDTAKSFETCHKNTEALTNLLGGIGNLESVWNYFNELEGAN